MKQTYGKLIMAIALMGCGLSASAQSVTKVTPSTDEVYNYVNTKEIMVTVTGSVTNYSKVTLNYGTNNSVELSGTPDNKYGVATNGSSTAKFLQIGGASYPEYVALINQIATSGNDSFQVVIEGLEDTTGPVTTNETGQEGVEVANGTVTLTYGLQEAPNYLPQQSTWPQTIYSYWNKGAASALVTLAFDQEIVSVSDCKMVMGHVEKGSEGGGSFLTEYNLIPNVTVSGTKLMIDLSGVERTGNQNVVTIILSNVVGKNGLQANFSSGNVVDKTLYQELNYSNTTAPGSDVEEVTYMSGQAQQLTQSFLVSDTYAAVSLLWPETVTIVNSDALSIPVYNGEVFVGNLTAPYVQLWAAGDHEATTDTRAATGDSGVQMYLLLAAANLINGEGTYLITLPEGIVENSNGAVNRQQTLSVVCIGGVVPEVSPVSGTEFKTGEEVVITFSFDGTVEQNYSPDAPVYVTNYIYEGEDAYEKSINWAAGVLYIENNAIILNLGNELLPATYYVSLREAQVVVDGNPNEAVSDYVFEVVENEESGAVKGLGVDVENAEIYNLNGVKVSNPGKGVYIVNGKKVVLK